MVPPNNAINLLEEAYDICYLSLIGTGWERHRSPFTREQACCLSLLHAIEVAILYTCMMEGENYEEMIELERTERPPHPW